MSKKEFKVEYQFSDILSREVELRITKCLEMLINLDDVYEQKDSKSIYDKG
jgi:hypothetical protein